MLQKSPDRALLVFSYLAKLLLLLGLSLILNKGSHQYSEQLTLFKSVSLKLQQCAAVNVAKWVINITLDLGLVGRFD
jgi:hypothetical protein